MKRIILFLLLSACIGCYAQSLEKLSRGMIVLPVNEQTAYIGWRMLATDAAGVAFDLYRQQGKATPVKLNKQLIVKTTDFTDSGVDFTKENTWILKDETGKEVGKYSIAAHAPLMPYISIPLQKPKGGVVEGEAFEYTANDCSVADLDGDGEYEIILKWEPTNPKLPPRPGFTGNTFIDAYKLDGRLMWRIDLGKNIRSGPPYTQFLVYDFDGCGKAEMIVKTGDGTRDGKGNYVGDKNADWRRKKGAGAVEGKIIDGPEYLTVFEGTTGKILASAEYIPTRYPLDGWGGIGGNGGNDNTGGRPDRFTACVAYLGGSGHSAVMVRGWYGRTVLAAWDYKDGKLSSRWVFDSALPEWEGYSGMGNHSVTVADFDGDGFDEICVGAMTVDHDGKGLFTTGLRHGDALHAGKLIPSREGLQVFGIHESEGPTLSLQTPGLAMFDGKTGEIIWSKYPGVDVGRGAAFDIDPRYPGAECWGGPGGLLRGDTGEEISKEKPNSCNFAVWWDADPLRELLDKNVISKWDWQSQKTNTLLQAEGVVANNGTKATPCLSGDILGDWREEVIWRTPDSRELRIYSTLIPAINRMPTLMHDHQYRMAIAWQNVAYNQPPHPSFDMMSRFWADKPLFVDPVYDGAADPVVIWNRAEKKWFMLYTNRRANMRGLDGVSWVHGTRIGVAESSDGGATWQYRDTCDIGYRPDADYTHWAPDVVYHAGMYHMYLTYVPGVFTDWNHPRQIVHLTSADLLHWDYQSTLQLASDRTIDASVFKMSNGMWRMYYNNERDRKTMYYADSPDLYNWTDYNRRVLSDDRGEGAKVFYWKNTYWMLIDAWDGLAVYSSPDLENWTKQAKNILREPGTGKADGAKGQHCDVVVSQGQAFVFYFVHQNARITQLQVAELEYDNGEMTCDRNKPVYIHLQPE